MTVYLLHFKKQINPSRPAQHYLGWTTDLDERIRAHRRGKGSRFCQVAFERGISFRVAEVWKGDRSLEQKLKQQKNSRRFCPICNKSRSLLRSQLISFSGENHALAN
jgi:predicted GIY-YIG superfamily endonuclease